MYNGNVVQNKHVFAQQSSQALPAPRLQAPKVHGLTLTHTLFLSSVASHTFALAGSQASRFMMFKMATRANSACERKDGQDECVEADVRVVW